MVVFLSVLTLLVVLEFFGHIFERGVGHYLKWENQSRPQLGRVWERDREKIVAQKKIKSLLFGLNLQEQSTDLLQSFKESQVAGSVFVSALEVAVFSPLKWREWMEGESKGER